MNAEGGGGGRGGRRRNERKENGALKSIATRVSGRRVTLEVCTCVCTATRHGVRNGTKEDVGRRGSPVACRRQGGGVMKWVCVCICAMFWERGRGGAATRPWPMAPRRGAAPQATSAATKLAARWGPRPPNYCYMGRLPAGSAATAASHEAARCRRCQPWRRDRGDGHAASEARSLLLARGCCHGPAGVCARRRRHRWLRSRAVPPPAIRAWRSSAAAAWLVR